MSRLPLFLFAALAASPVLAEGVVRPPVPPVPPVIPAVDPGRDRQAPFVAKVDGPTAPAPGSTIRLRLSIDRRSIDDASPMTIRVAIPSGTRLVEGAAEESIVGGARRIERTFVLALGDRVPGDDVVIEVDQRAEGWGGHAAARYRFGRPEAAPAPLERDERPVILDGKDLGRPILLR